MTVFSASRTCAVALLALVLLGAAAAHAQSPDQDRTQSIVTTTGEGIVRAVPDRAWITVGVESRAKSAREAQQRNAEQMRPVLDKVRGAGIPADAIRTTGYDVQYEWDFVDGKRVGRGYVARNTVEIRVDDISKVAGIIEIAGSSGASSIGGVRFDLKNRAALERDALRQAVAEARQKADALVSAAGRSLDRIIRIDEQGGPSPMPVRTFAREALAASAKDSAPPIETGELEVRAAVSLTATMK